MPLKEQLLGTSWELVQFVSEGKNGKELFPLGEDAKGVIMFTPDQQLSVHIIAADREKKLTEETLANYNTEAERKMAEFGYHAYTGPFDLDEEQQILTTYVRYSLVSSYIDSDQTRAVKIDGNHLYLVNVKHPERQLIWKKIVK